MPAQSKINMLQKVEKSLEESKGLFVINYGANASTAADNKGGLTVAEAQELRHQLREVGGHMKVYKNNIVKIALANAGLPAIDDVLVGTCAYVFYENDPVGVAKTLRDFAKATKKTEVIGGIADGTALNAAEAKAYADLPSYEEVMAQLVYVLASPLRGLMTVVNGPARGLALAMKAIAEKEQPAA